MSKVDKKLKTINKEYEKIVTLKNVNIFSQKGVYQRVYFEKLSIYNKSYKIKPTLSSFIIKDK